MENGEQVKALDFHMNYCKQGFYAVAVAALSSLGCSSSGRSDQGSAEKMVQSPADPVSKPNTPTARHVTPLLKAVGSGDEAEVRALLKAGANPDDPRASRSPLIQAVTSLNRTGGLLYCNAGVVKALLEHGADPNRADPMIGALPLHTAFDVGDIECARIIRTAGGRVDAFDDRGHTILAAAVGAAARTGNIALVDEAISWGIDPNARDRDGGTALHKAVWVDSAVVVKALLNRGVDPCIQNRIEQTPLAMARNLGRSSELIEILLHTNRCEK